MPNLNSGAISITAIIIAATMVLLEVVDATLFRVDGLVLMPEWVKPDGFQRLELALEVRYKDALIHRRPLVKFRAGRLGGQGVDRDRDMFSFKGSFNDAGRTPDRVAERDILKVLHAYAPLGGADRIWALTTTLLEGAGKHKGNHLAAVVQLVLSLSEPKSRKTGRSCCAYIHFPGQFPAQWGNIVDAHEALFLDTKMPNRFVLGTHSVPLQLGECLPPTFWKKRNNAAVAAVAVAAAAADSGKSTALHEQQQQQPPLNNEESLGKETEMINKKMH